MKKSIIILAFTLVSSIVLAQTTTENYVKSTTYKQPVKNQSEINALSNDDKIETINYLDGLGRPKQSISKQAGGNKEDIIIPIVYDDYGRQAIEYLPYSRTSSSLNYQTQDANFYNTLNSQYLTKYPLDMSSSNPNPYSEKSFESSPLSRVLEQGAPGTSWSVDSQSDNDHTIKFSYQINSDKIDRYKVVFPTLDYEQPQLFYDNHHLHGELYKSITKDENWQPNQLKPNAHTTVEYTNPQGQVILKRTFDSNGIAHDTNYIYDDFGNLTYVLSPKGTDIILKAEKGYYDKEYFLDWRKFVPIGKRGELVAEGEGGLDVIINTSLNTIELKFYLEFSENINLRTGPIALIEQPLPNMVVGTINNGSYTVSILDGYLYIAGNGLLESVNDHLIQNLPSASINNDALDDLCYQYHYDKRNRLVEKKIPQKGWEYIVYDNLDRPVLTQDANLRQNNYWLFTKYDKFDRVTYTGLFNGRSSNTRLNLQSQLSNASVNNETTSSNTTIVDGTAIYYSNAVYPSTNLTLHTVNYYDSYNPTLSNTLPNPSTVFGQQITGDTKSLATGSLIRVLETNAWITSVTYYDEKAQAVYIGSNNGYLSTEDIVKSEIDFTGIVLKNESTHQKNSGTPLIITNRYTYDHANRLLTQKQQITGQPEELIVSNTYDELGQLINKDVGNIIASPLQTVDYTYNIRGWLTQINDPQAIGNDLFTFKINYDRLDLSLNANKLYNGNISETIWKTANDPNTTSRGYAYEYDALNRLKSANMALDSGSGYTQTNGYHLNGLSYDKNGNILALQRTGETAVFDQLLYFYNGNQLQYVNDAITNQQTEGFIDGNTSGNDYLYDTNGNMTQDLNKGITSITYNYLNLPTNIDIVSNDQGDIMYVYDATGVKISKRVTTDIVVNGFPSSITETTHYAGNYIYENNTLKMFSHPEGYVEPNGSNFDYIYQYKDHLGNIRLSYSDTNNDGAVNASEIIEENNYYPFGLEHKGYNNVVSPNSNSIASKFKYNGIEKEEALGADWYEMPLRQYDPAIARWTSIDPVTHFNFSTYTAFDNNPVFWADPSGADSEVSEDGNRITFTGADARDAFRILKANMSSDDGGTDPKKKKKKKSGQYQGANWAAAGSGHAAGYAYGGAGYAAAMRGGDPANPTEADQKRADAAVGEFVLLISGEWAITKIFQGGAWVYRIVQAKRIISKAKWAQKTFGLTFQGGKYAGETIDDVVNLLNIGKAKAKDLPIDVIVRDGNTLILNTRSSAALSRAGIPRSQWKVVNRTGQEFYENQLTNQLTRNKLTNSGTSTIRQSGTQKTISN